MFGFVCIMPFITVIGTSFISETEWVRRGAFIIWPEKPDLTSYKILLGGSSSVYRGFLMSFLRVFMGTFCNLLVTIPLAYALSKKFLGRTFITFAIFFTMLFSGGLIPTYILVHKLGLLNSFWSMIIPGLVNPWWMLIMRKFFGEIPDSYEESAIIDGASFLTIIIRIIIPLSLASIATIGLFYAVWHWNDWFTPFIYLTDNKLWPLQNRLKSILDRTLTETIGVPKNINIVVLPPTQSLRSAMIVITTIPILLVYPFIQKYFVKGVKIGGIKG